MTNDESKFPRTTPATIRSTLPDQRRTPDLRQVNSMILSEGVRVRREVVHVVIQSRNTGEIKPNQIGFRTRRLKNGMWENEPSKSFTLNSDDEIRDAIRFIAAACGGSIPDVAGSFVVVPTAAGIDVDAIQAGLNDLTVSGQSDVLAGLLRRVAQERGAAIELFRRVASNPDAFAAAAATLNLARYRGALRQLEALVAGKSVERDFQSLLQSNPWMFGSEYSEHLADSRHLTRDTQQDFLLRRTTDGYVEVVEIKTPLPGIDLFRFDKSRNLHFAGPEVSAAVGQASKYIEELEADRLSIIARDQIDTLKVRAKVIIGRDGDDKQRIALRRFNGHLHRVEVITFDQLVAIARRVTQHLLATVSADQPNDQLDRTPA